MTWGPYTVRVNIHDRLGDRCKWKVKPLYQLSAHGATLSVFHIQDLFLFRSSPLVLSTRVPVIPPKLFRQSSPGDSSIVFVPPLLSRSTPFSPVLVGVSVSPPRVRRSLGSRRTDLHRWDFRDGRGHNRPRPSILHSRPPPRHSSLVPLQDFPLCVLNTVVSPLPSRHGPGVRRGG